MKKRQPPLYQSIILMLKKELEKEKNFQQRMAREGAGEFYKARMLKSTIKVMEWLGEDGYNDLMRVPIQYGLPTMNNRRKAIEQLRAAYQRCEELGVINDIENFKQTIN